MLVVHASTLNKTYLFIYLFIYLNIVTSLSHCKCLLDRDAQSELLDEAANIVVICRLCTGKRGIEHILIYTHFVYLRLTYKKRIYIVSK
jgi:hypothetical protein